MMNCEEYQVNLSALIDGELDGQELTDTIKHLAVCQDCMKVFEDFQQLQVRIDTELESPAVPLDTWDTIDKNVPRAKQVRLSTRRSIIYKSLSLAAVLAISFFLGYYGHQTVLPAIQAGDPIVLASHSGDMNETQFLSLTRDLLSADPVYHKKMYMILHTLLDEEWEGNVEPLEQAVFENDDNGDTFRF